LPVGLPCINPQNTRFFYVFSAARTRLIGVTLGYILIGGAAHEYVQNSDVSVPGFIRVPVYARTRAAG
jgi:hypothetical protein